MEFSTITLALILALVAGIASMTLTIAVCYYFYPRKLEELQSFPFPDGRKQSVVELKRHNVEDRLSKDTIGIITPLVTSVTVQPVTTTSKEDISVQPLAPEIEPIRDRGSISGNEVTCTFSYVKDASAVKVNVSVTHCGDRGHTSFIRCCLLPEKKYLVEKKAKLSAIAQRWNDTFYFDNVSGKNLSRACFYLQLCSFNGWRYKIFGEIHLSLLEEDFLQKRAISKSIEVPETPKLGELLLSLMYDNHNNEITVSVVKTRFSETEECLAENYVALATFGGETALDKRKTKILPIPNSSFNEIFHFPLTKYTLTEFSLVATLVRISDERNLSCGVATISSLSGGVSTRQWTDMQRRPRTPVLQWHKM